MTTTPTTPGSTASPVSSIETTVKNDLTWLKAHVIQLVIVAALVFGSVSGIENIIAKHDLAATAREEAQLSAQAATTKALEDKITTDEAASAARDAAAQARFDSLAQTILKRDAAGTQARQVAGTLDATATAAAISTETKGAATATGNIITMDLPTGRVVNQDLILLGQVQADYKDAQSQIAAVQTQLDDMKVDNTDLRALVASQVTQLGQQANTCQQEIKTAKAVARKSKAKWFVVGYAAGFVSAVAVIFK